MEYGKNESWNNWSYRICGKNKKVNSNVINDCLKNGYISVIATVGVDEEGHSYNVNGDLAASVVIDELESPGFYEEVEAKGKYIKDYIKNLNSDKVVEVRGKGLMIGIELN